VFHLERAVVTDTQLAEQQLPDQPAATRRVVDVGDPVQDLPEICECRCGAPGWRTTRLGAGDPT
jgi:hypothetical protein